MLVHLEVGRGCVCHRSRSKASVSQVINERARVVIRRLTYTGRPPDAASLVMDQFPTGWK
jgi:hypothetical protein